MSSRIRNVAAAENLSTKNIRKAAKAEQYLTLTDKDAEVIEVHVGTARCPTFWSDCKVDADWLISDRGWWAGRVLSGPLKRPRFSVINLMSLAIVISKGLFCNFDICIRIEENLPSLIVCKYFF